VASKGSMTYAFTHMGHFLLLPCPSVGPPPSLEAQIPVPKPKSQSHDPNPSLETQILAWRLGSRSLGGDLGLKAEIWASRLGFGLEAGI